MLQLIRFNKVTKESLGQYIILNNKKIYIHVHG